MKSKKIKFSSFAIGKHSIFGLANSKVFHAYKSNIHPRKYEENMIEKYFVHNISK